MKQEGFRSGFVAIIGRTNVGKSTFLNRILDQKIAIVSNKPQTTRNRIVGVYHAEQVQIVFLDTPGFHKPKHRLNELMLHTTLKTLEGIDVVLYVVEPEQKIGPGDRYILDVLRKVETPVLLAINKIDLVRKDTLLPVIDLRGFIRSAFFFNISDKVADFEVESKVFVGTPEPFGKNP